MKRVLVTRAAEDAVRFCHALIQRGLEPVSVPLLERVWQVDAMIEAAQAWPQPDWLVLTSAAAVDVWMAGAPRAWQDAKLAAVGSSTARRVAAIGRRVDAMPDRFLGAQLVERLGDLRGQRVVYPRADLAPPAVMELLAAAGAEVHSFVAYRNRPPAGHAERLVAALPVDYTPLLSGSAARRLAEAVRADAAGLGVVVAIGPSTAEAAQDAGLPVHRVASPHSLDGLLLAMER